MKTPLFKVSLLREASSKANGIVTDTSSTFFF